MIVFDELWYVLLIEGDILIDTSFANASKPIQFDNKQDMQGWIEILYAKIGQSSRDVTLSTYHKIDPTIFWFINITGYC